jgi:hypothetical protein
MNASRRDFLFAAGGLMIALPVGWSIAGCGSGTTANNCANADKLVTSGTSLVFTSSCDLTHTHDFTLMTTELTTPPSAGVMRDTSVDTFDNHMHSVTLTQAELMMIESGTPIMKTTSLVNQHTHTYMFRKA